MFDGFDLGDPVVLATLLGAVEEQGDSLEITIRSAEEIGAVVALVEERFGAEVAGKVRRALEDLFTKG